MTNAPSREALSRDSLSGHVGGPVIIVGVDGSDPSWDALAWAAGEALRSNGRIVAVLATPPFEPGEVIGSTAPLGYAAAAETRDQVAEQLAAEVARRAETLGVEVRFERRVGEAPWVLHQVALSEQADLMVVGRSAKMVHRLAGSVGRRLVLRHDGPVTVVVP
jgi:nucleotide-binding universal stress UspA family protein